MNFDVKFDMDPMTLEADLGEIYDISGGEAERLWQEGYTDGRTEGYQSGYTEGESAGYEKGESAGYETGYSAGVEAGGKTEDKIVARTISGEYTNSRITAVGNYAFRSCTKLTAVQLPKVTSISSYAFGSCTKLTTVRLPKVAYITTNAFNGCSQLVSVILHNSTRCVLGAESAFTGTPIKSGTGYIYVPDALVEGYKAATNWSTYADQIKPLSELEG